MRPIRLGACTLRPWTPADRDSLVRYGDNRNVWRNLTDVFPHPYTLADADSWIAHAKDLDPMSQFAIEVDGTAAGGIGVGMRAGWQARTGEFGYWLGEPFWGRGIATLAVRAMVQYAFQALPVHRLESSVFEWNPASMRVLEKAGFAREGVLRRSVWKDGCLIDRVLFARLRTDADGPAPATA